MYSRKGDTDAYDRLKIPSPEADDRLARTHDENDMSEWNRRRQDERKRSQRDEEDRRRQEDEENRRDEQDREDIAEQAKLMKTNSDDVSITF